MENQKKIEFLKNISFLAHLSAATLAEIASGVEQRVFQKHDIVFREDDIADGMYVIIFGEVEVAMGMKVIAKLGLGDFFGELALITDKPRVGSVGVVSETCSALFLSKEAFEKIKYKVSPDDQREVIRRVQENSERKKKEEPSY